MPLTCRTAAVPQLLLAPSTAPGVCLPLSGSSGFADIRLRQPIRATAVSLQHIPASIAFDIRSAPWEVAVHGFRGPPVTEQPGTSASASAAEHSTGGAASGGVELTRMQYSLDGPPVQTFIVRNNTAVVDHVRVLVRKCHDDVATDQVCCADGGNPGLSVLNIVCHAVRAAQVLSNHGHDAHTCLYRVRVHGIAHGAPAASQQWQKEQR